MVDVQKKQFNGIVHSKELEIMKIWDINGIHKSKPINSQKIFNFTDGPPFVSSDTLHFGHLAIGYAKDTILRFKKITGHWTDDQIGFDCHGVPTETRACKDLDMKSNDIKDYGIDNFCNFCSKMIDNYSDSWNDVYTLMARGFDINNRYFTKDNNFMESVIWAFKQFYDKNLVRRGYGVHPYSIGCQTVLSAWESKEAYQTVSDLSLFVKFQLKEEDNTYFIAWTTTPWTLPSNLALCVNPNTEYSKIEDNTTGEYYYVATANIVNLYGKKSKEGVQYKTVKKKMGKSLVGKKYTPLFNIFAEYDKLGCFQIYCDEFVKTEEKEEFGDFEESKTVKAKTVGTGIVHMAPAFGEDDFKVCNFIPDSKIAETCIIDDCGNFTDVFNKYANKLVFDCNNDIAEDLGDKVFKKQQYQHRYPFCDRTQTRIVYKIVDVIFLEVTKIKNQMIDLNKQVRWIPESVGTGRFNQWLEDCRDWAVSRTRYYGTPIPMWVSEDGTEIKVFGSIKEIENACGKKINDLHRQYLDDIVIVSDLGKPMHRVPFVFDCWFDSGCVPFAKKHYPFENHNFFDDKTFLSDLFLEGIDQTRGWFYSTLVISTAIFNKPNANTIVCCGIVLASDSKKMSKRQKNYTDPDLTIKKFTSDSTRIYLISSPILKAESIKFNELFLQDVTRKLTPLINSVNLFLDYADMIEKKDSDFIDGVYTLSDVSDRWILSKTDSLVKNIAKHMDTYRINMCINDIFTFIEDFCNWYLKLNRHRIKNIDLKCLSTFLNCLHKVSITISPFMPFTAEYIYQTTIKFKQGKSSVHLERLPSISNIDKDVEKSFQIAQNIVIEVRNLRLKNKNFSSVKKPIKIMSIYCDSKTVDKLVPIIDYVKKECNFIDIQFIKKNVSDICKKEFIPDFKNIGKDFNKQSKRIVEIIKNSVTENELVFNGLSLIKCHHYTVKFELDSSLLNNRYTYVMFGDCVLEIDFTEDKEIEHLYITRCVNSIIQQGRGKFGYKPVDNLVFYIFIENETLLNIINFDELGKKTNSVIKILKHKNSIPVEEAIKTLDSQVYIYAEKCT